MTIETYFKKNTLDEKIFLGNIIHAGSGREACRVRLVFE